MDKAIYYILKNPQGDIRGAEICFLDWGGRNPASCILFITFRWGRTNGDIYKNLVTAKRCFTRDYQSKKYGFETPIWEKKVLEIK